MTRLSTMDAADGFEIGQLDYALPRELIAREPPVERDGARLLHLAEDGLHDRTIRELPLLLPTESLLVVNDSRVLPARIFARRATGGRVELLLVERVAVGSNEEQWLAMARPMKSLRDGESLTSTRGDASIRVGARQGDHILVTLSGANVRASLHQIGQIPLPPYLEREARPEDDARYQTVFAKHDGSVAAPTAGLHLSTEVLAGIRSAGHEVASITLHVGPGTFRPIETTDLAQHRMHEERYEISEETAARINTAREAGRPIVAVGTTVVRTLESVATDQGVIAARSGRTSIFIRPPYRFRAVDVLMTNFHLPRSTLLALVMAFAGAERTRRAYAHAIEARYRFYSYGDAMLIERPRSGQ